MAKLDKEEDLASKFFSIGYDYLLKGRWEVSKYIFHSLNRIGGQTEADIWCNKVNYYVSCKNLDGIDSIRQEIEKMDVSLMKPRMALAKPALLDDYTSITKILEETIDNGISVAEIKSWPLLLQYRKSEEYKEFISNHAENFEIETCSTDDIQCISEKSEHIS